MIKYILHIAGFLALILAVGLILFYTSNTIDPLYALDKERIDSLLANRNEIEAISVGHSGNRALDFETLGLKGFHLWKGGTDFFETKFVIEIVVPLLPNLEVIFIPISPFGAFHDNSDVRSRADLRNRYYIIYEKLSHDKLINNDYRNYLLAKLAPLVRGDHWSGVYTNLGMKIKKVFSDSKKLRSPQVDKYGRLLNNKNLILDAHDLNWGIVHIDLANQVIARNPYINEDVKIVLKEIVKYCDERKIKLIFYSPPAHIKYLNTVKNIDRNDYFVRGNKFFEENFRNFGIEYYNFSYYPEISENQDYYLDENHLNDLGAKVFSKMLLERLEFDGPE